MQIKDFNLKEREINKEACFVYKKTSKTEFKKQ